MSNPRDTYGMEDFFQDVTGFVSKVGTTSYEYIKAGFKVFSEFSRPLLCIFDDLPTVFVSSSGKMNLPKDFGLFTMVAMGYIVFLNELREGITKFIKARNMKKEDESRNTLIAIHLAKIIFALLGLAITTTLLALTLTGICMVASILSIGVPAVVAVIVGIELAEKVYGLVRALRKNDEEACIHAKRKVTFGSISFILSVIIAGLATVSILVGLGVISGGIAPVAVLMTVVGIAVLVKAFEFVDKKMNYKLTNGIRRFFTGSSDEQDPSPNESKELSNTDRILNKTIHHLDSTSKDEKEELLVELKTVVSDKPDDKAPEPILTIVNSDRVDQLSSCFPWNW